MRPAASRVGLIALLCAGGVAGAQRAAHAAECGGDAARTAAWTFEDRMNQQGYPAEALAHYADGYASVVRFGGASVSREAMDRRDQAVFASFPERAYHIEDDSLAVSCENGGTRVSAVVSWAFRRADHALAAQGETRVSYTYDPSWKIIAVSEQVLAHGTPGTVKVSSAPAKEH